MQDKKNYSKSELTYFAKQCEKGEYYMLTGCCFADEITHTEIGRMLSSESFADDQEELLLEVSKRYAKRCREQSSFNVENAEVQDFQSIIAKIVNCCEEHNWFEE